MSIDIVDQLKQELSRIDALQGAGKNASRPANLGKRRHMTAAARARIGAAKKAWWAGQKQKRRTKKKAY